MKKLCLLLALLLCLNSLIGCRAESARSQNFYLMDTLIGVTLYTKTEKEAEEIFAACENLLAELEVLWARQRPQSEIARFNTSDAGIENLDLRTLQVVKTAIDVSRATDGAFDITVTPLVELWAACEKAGRLPVADEMDAALASVGYESIELTESGITKSRAEVAVDLGGIGKGAAISHLIAFLENSGARGGLVSFGSNVAVFGEKPNQAPFRVAIKNPRLEGGSIGTLTLPAGAVLSVSGDYERYVTIGDERYHHILDPATGYPADTGLASVAVVTKDGALADALSTALFVMGETDARALYASGVYDFEAIFVDTNGGVRYTDGLSNIFVMEE